MRTALLVLALLLAQGRSDPATVSLAGQVVDADSRAPIAGARVIALTAGAQEEVTTDREGRFLFERLVRGRYRMQAEKAGFVANRAAAFVVVTLTGAGGGLELPLHRAGVLAGQVVDERGAPMAGARVQALRREGQPGMPGTQGPPVLTNDLGEFRVASLMSGAYVVLAAPPVNAASGDRAYVPTYYPAAPDPAAAFTVTLEPGETAFSLYITMLTSDAYEISGLVVDEQGRPMANANVQVVLREARAPMSYQSSMRSHPTAADGTFRINGFPPGRYRLTASARPGGAPSQQALMESILSGLAKAAADDTASVQVEIVARDVSGVRLVVTAER